MRNEITRGMKDSIPICAGYLAVGFTFGMAAAAQGINAFGSGLICFTNVTSAGQFAGLTVIAAGAPLIEMALTQLIINMRYVLMSISLSQKLDASVKWYEKCIMACGVTDEVFALVSTQKGKVNKYYIYGLIFCCILAWTCGGFFGAFASNALPTIVSSALGIAIYGMFMAIIIPAAREERPVTAVIIIAAILSSLMEWAPVLRDVSPGMAIIICTVLAATAGAIIHPVEEEEAA